MVDAAVAVVAVHGVVVVGGRPGQSSCIKEGQMGHLVRWLGCPQPPQAPLVTAS